MKNHSTESMPLLFVGHGSPMNAIETNAFTRALAQLGQALPRPKAILVISAHWLTEGTWVTAMERPRTIHDFVGFPKPLFEVQYPAPGSPETAQKIHETVLKPMVHLDADQWGLDHGTWAVLRHLYPDANIPVLQLSVDVHQSPDYHRNLGHEISKFREEGVLIIGSGNLVHNLSKIRWEADAQAYDWAIQFDEWIQSMLLEGDYHSVMNDFHSTPGGKLSVPTLEHYFPMHYILGAAKRKDRLRFEYEGIQNGSISMRTFSLGR
jgi:4,5-DOPA dioxygenase extradiol